MKQFLESMKSAFEQMKINFLEWIELTVLYLPNLIVAIMIVGIAVFISKYIRRMAKRAAMRISPNSNVVNLVGKLSVFIFGIVILMIVLSIFDLSDTINKLLAAAGVAGLAIGLALQDPMNNMLSGVFMSVRSLYKLGDLVESNGYFGTIKDINLRETRLKLPTGEDVVLPNKSVLQNPLKNFSYTDERRIDIDCGVSYGDDLTKVEDVVKKAIAALPNVQEKRPIQVVYTGFGGSSIDFTVRYWLENTSHYDFLVEKSRGIKAIKDSFDKYDIAIPFPITTLDFGGKGGVSLPEVMAEDTSSIFEKGSH